MKACVVFHNRYGNMEKIASSFETGLRDAGIQTVRVDSKEVSIESLKGCDLVAVGGPTEKTTASVPIKEVLARLEGVDFSGKFGFVFDIKLGYPLTGSAARFVEKRLMNLGIKIVHERASAIVIPQKKEWVQQQQEERGEEGWVHEEYYPLKEGEEKRFEELGHQIGAALLSKTSIPSPGPLLQN
jgi:flavorubredoxin